MGLLVLLVTYAVILAVTYWAVRKLTKAKWEDHGPR